MYRLEQIDYICLKVLGFHHKAFSLLDNIQGYGLSHGGFFCPEEGIVPEKSGFTCYSSDDDLDVGSLSSGSLVKQTKDHLSTHVDILDSSSSSSDVYHEGTFLVQLQIVFLTVLLASPVNTVLRMSSILHELEMIL